MTVPGVLLGSAASPEPGPSERRNREEIDIDANDEAAVTHAGERARPAGERRRPATCRMPATGRGQLPATVPSCPQARGAGEPRAHTPDETRCPGSVRAAGRRGRTAPPSISRPVQASGGWMTSLPRGRRLLHRVPRPECGLRSDAPGPSAWSGPCVGAHWTQDTRRRCEGPSRSVFPGAGRRGTWVNIRAPRPCPQKPPLLGRATPCTHGVVGYWSRMFFVSLAHVASHQK